MAQPKGFSDTLVYLNETVPCYSSLIYNENGIWKGTNPLVDVLPLFLVQLTVSIFVTRIFILVFKPLKLPRFVAEVIGGIFLGPSGLGHIKAYIALLFPNGGFLVMDPLTHFALVQYAFLTGLKMDLSVLPGIGKRAVTVAVCGFLVPLLVGTGLFFMFGSHIPKSNNGALFWATALTVTGYPDLTKLLQRLKMHDTDVGKKALYSTLISDILSWSLFAVAISISFSSDDYRHDDKRNDKKWLNPVWTTIAMMAAVFSAKYHLRPALVWVVRQVPDGHQFSEYYLCSVMVGAFLAGLFSDACGTHPIVGAFIFGLVVPKGELEVFLVDKMDFFVTGLMMPIFFVACGHRTDLDHIADDSQVWLVILVVALACVAKFFSAFIESLLHNVPIRDTLRLGVLMSNKSVFAVIVLYIGVEQKVLTDQTYTVMMVAMLLMTVLVTIIMHSNRNNIQFVPYKQRTLQKSKHNEDLRILACVHGVRNIASIIGILEATHASRESNLCVYALHLVEQIGHSSAMNVVQHSHKSFSKNPAQIEADQIISTFEDFSRRHDFITLQPLILRSTYATMDEYICEVLEEKRCSMVILPFHLQQNMVGDMEDVNPAIRQFNENMLTNAPCSVGILVDRGLASSGDFPSHIAMLYVGGPDDREALSYASRMARHPSVTLKVTRFLPSQNLATEPLTVSQGMLAVNIENASEKELDEAFIARFKESSTQHERIQYEEMVLENEEATIMAIRSMDRQFDLFVVGRGRGVTSPLTEGLTDWCDCPELGPIGDALVTSEFTSAFAVVVVQQYALIGGSSGSGGSFSTISSSMDFQDGNEGSHWSQPHGGDHSSFANSPARHRDMNIGY